MTPWVQWTPPSVLTPATRPRDPPFDHRSCCQPPTMLLELTGLTATIGSTSLFGTFLPGCPAALSAVHEAKGLVPETWTSGSSRNVGGSGCTPVRPAARRRNPAARRERRMYYSFPARNRPGLGLDRDVGWRRTPVSGGALPLSICLRNDTAAAQNRYGDRRWLR